jgi:hypothetical protein
MYLPKSANYDPSFAETTLNVERPKVTRGQMHAKGNRFLLIFQWLSANQTIVRQKRPQYADPGTKRAFTHYL